MSDIDFDIDFELAEDDFSQTFAIVTSVIDGYNVYIFDYEQTKIGKIFTMEGEPENKGVIYRTLERLFNNEVREAVP